jgi:hypothetical protein
MIKNIIIGCLTCLSVLAFTFAAYQKSEAEKQREEAIRQLNIAIEMKVELVKMEMRMDSLKIHVND